MTKTQITKQLHALSQITDKPSAELVKDGLYRRVLRSLGYKAEPSTEANMLRLKTLAANGIRGERSLANMALTAENLGALQPDRQSGVTK